MTNSSLQTSKTNETLIGQAYTRIQLEIVEGRLLPGAVLSEASLSKQLGISRTPINAALRQLAFDGLVEQIPRFGTVVRSVTRDELVDLYEVREALEAYAAEKAAHRVNSAQLERLDQWCQTMTAVADELKTGKDAALNDDQLGRFLNADLSFHMTIIEAAANPRISEIVRQTRTLSRIFRTYRQAHTHAIVSTAINYHIRITTALRAKDATAAHNIMAEHIQASLKNSIFELDHERATRGQRASAVPLPAAVQNKLHESN